MASERENKWLESYLETGNAQAAVAQIFDCNGQKSIACRASQLKRKFAHEIDKRLREEFSQGSVKMLQIIKNLAMSAQSEQVKLNAAKDYLDRGGYKPVDRQEIAEVPTTREQLESEYQAALQALTGQDLKILLASLPDSERQTLIASLSETEH